MAARPRIHPQGASLLLNLPEDLDEFLGQVEGVSAARHRVHLANEACLPGWAGVKGVK